MDPVHWERVVSWVCRRGDTQSCIQDADFVSNDLRVKHMRELVDYLSYLLDRLVYILEHNPYYAQPLDDDEDATPICSEVSSDSE